MKLGIVGLPNVGKSTLFNAITNANVEAANYPFATIEPNIGVVNVPDERLSVVREINQSERILPATIEFYDIAGLVQGASEGEGLGNQFLANIREVDAIVHVVRAFDDPNIIHVDGEIDPIRDINTINTELILADLETVEKIEQRLSRAIKGNKNLEPEYEFVLKLKENLEKGILIKNLILTETEEKMLKSYNLLTSKKVIYAANVSEEFVGDEDSSVIESIKEFAKKENSEVVKVSAEIEAQIAQLDSEEERSEFLESLGIHTSGLDKLIQSSYSLLGLISYITAGPKETRAWTIKRGTTAQKAAGVIHTDMERGFIRAEVISYDDLVKAGSMTNARDKGLMRLEGRDYIVEDGDICLFRFNV